jgi:sulfur-oxidizing protein SoxZ
VAEPTRIRATLAGDKATVRMLLSHEMESGQRKDASGKLVPAWHIQTVNVSHNGRPVLSFQCGPAVSKNPFFQFSLRGAKPGDRVAVHWLDSRGNRRSDEATIA